MKTPMKTVELLERPTQAFEVAIAPVESEYSLNIAGVYQDGVTRLSAIKLIAEQASPASQEIQELHGRPCAAYYQSGLNEQMDKLVACQTCGLVQEAASPLPRRPIFKRRGPMARFLA